MTPNKRVEPTLAIGLPSLPLRSANCKRGSPLVLGVTKKSNRW
jgi:hypothetical protein